MNLSLELKKICKSFDGKVIFSNISLVFKRGCYVITGPNGIGKSVLLEILSGVLNQDSGSVVFNNIDESGITNYKKYLTYIPSKPDFFPSATGADFFSFIYSVRNKKINENLFLKITEEFRLNDYLHIKFSDMSLGSQKKLFLSTLAMSESKLFVMDEPTNALDEQSSRLLTDLIIELSKNNIVIIATHDMNLVRNINPNVLELKSTPVFNLIAEGDNAI